MDYADRYGMLVWEENRFVTPGVVPMSEPEEEEEDQEGSAGLFGARAEGKGNNACHIDNYCPDNPSGPDAECDQ